MRGEQRVPAIGRDATRRQRRETEDEPAQEQRLAPRAIHARYRVEREPSDQHQAEHEAAMQIGPQRHQRQQPPGRRLAAIGGRDQSCGPRHQHRQRQHMRSRQKMRRAKRKRRRNEQQRRAFGETAADKARQQRKGQGDRACRQRHRPRPAAERKSLGVHHLRQPLRGDPGLAAHGEGIDVLRRHGVVVDDPLPDGQLPLRIGISQQAIARKHHHHVDRSPHPGRQQPAQRRRSLTAVDGGDAHGLVIRACDPHVSGRIEPCRYIMLGKAARLSRPCVATIMVRKALTNERAAPHRHAGSAHQVRVWTVQTAQSRVDSLAHGPKLELFRGVLRRWS